jgi:hypothetical protein
MGLSIRVTGESGGSVATTGRSLRRAASGAITRRSGGVYRRPRKPQAMSPREGFLPGQQTLRGLHDGDLEAVQAVPRRGHFLLGCAAAQHGQSARHLLGRGGAADVPGLVVAQSGDGRDDRSGTGGQDLPPGPPALRQPRSRHIGLPLPFPLSFDRTSSQRFDADRLPAPSFSGRPLGNLSMTPQGAAPAGRVSPRWGPFSGTSLFRPHRSPDLAGARPPLPDRLDELAHHPLEVEIHDWVVPQDERHRVR